MTVNPQDAYEFVLFLVTLGSAVTTAYFGLRGHRRRHDPFGYIYHDYIVAGLSIPFVIQAITYFGAACNIHSLDQNSLWLSVFRGSVLTIALLCALRAVNGKLVEVVNRFIDKGAKWIGKK